MKNITPIVTLLVCATFLNGCSNKKNVKGTFGYDLEYLNKHKKTIVLKSNNDLCQISVVADYQGRVMTSTSNGMNGKSYGWINYDLIAANKFEEHINAFGGEDRFWLGPEGGQFSIFFRKGDDFTLKNWFTPKEIDTEAFTLVHSNDTVAHFTRKMNLQNYSGTVFDIEIERNVSIFSKPNIEKNLDIALGDKIQFVGYQSENTMKNSGSEAWSKQQGLLSIWILGMFLPSESTTVIVPYKDSLALNTSYFGEIGPDRLQIVDNTVLFKGDGKYRSKIGLPPQNVLPKFGSYDSDEKILTVIEYSFSGDSTYVNSLWKLQENPYGGDVINSYNDGPLEDGSQLGPFYELESSSPAKELKQNESIKHIHKTYHFEGDFEALNAISKKVLGFDLTKLGHQKK
ncbi:DUF6786 family protein [Spongiimicrobium sp. 3-5]|uniref:DUF6786 family protein n=1 Tax=Spongiimicrobium sp. 3-5 TaxID=3332596 RepID=UPI003980B52C